VTTPHLELSVWEPSDPKQQRRAHCGRRGCEPVIVHDSTMRHSPTKSNGTTRQKKIQYKARRRLPLEIIEHDGVRHDLAEAGDRVELSDDLCAQTERNGESGRLHVTRSRRTGHEWGPRVGGGGGGGRPRAVPRTGDVGALPAAARAARCGLRRLKVAGFGGREVNLTS
jgi:hypothetical protein